MVHAEHLNLIALAKQTTLTYTLWTSYVGIWGGAIASCRAAHSAKSNHLLLGTKKHTDEHINQAS